ncbi:hypothetical protein AAAC51_07285 [Priestia megaterium]
MKDLTYIKEKMFALAKGIAVMLSRVVENFEEVLKINPLECLS